MDFRHPRSDKSVQSFSQGPARNPRDETSQSIAATDSVDAIIFQFTSLETSTVPVPTPGGADAAASVPSTLDAAPAMTRRELRERERATASARAAVTAADVPAADVSAADISVPEPSAPADAGSSSSSASAASPRRTARALLFESEAAGSAVAGVVELPSRRAARAADSSRPEKVQRIRARKGAKSRSLRLSADTHPAGRPTVAAAITAAPRAAREKAQSVKRSVLQNLASVGAMVGVGLILVATTVPANAFSRPDTDVEASDTQTAISASATKGTQELEVAEVAAPELTRDGYTATSLQQQLASRESNRLYTYVNDPAGSVQWPFPEGSPITSGFGGRSVAGCGFCSTYHEGLDFTPGAGTPIHAIADGVVSDVQSSGAFGNHVVIDHIVNGQKVQSLYAHMQYGSVQVAVGELVTVGQIVGAVGSTGASTGPHLHLEVHLDGTPVDPFAWLNANAN